MSSFRYLIVAFALLAFCTSIVRGQVLETHASLQAAAAGSVQVMETSYHSIMLGTALPVRAFSPKNPTWEAVGDGSTITSAGMRLVIYVMNLQGVPRPSAADDRKIIEDLIKDDFLVLTVDFGGAQMKTHLDLQKDISGLFCAFGGKWHTRQSYFTVNRKKLLDHPGPSVARARSTIGEIPINRAAIYVIPSGYTVEPQLVFRDGIQGADWKRRTRTEVFCDLIYPKASAGNEAVPLLLEGSSTSTGGFVVNANTPILYSWLFNGYALASFCYVRTEDENHYLLDALRFFHAKKDRFSLSGKVGTAGISKSCRRCFTESNMKPGDGDAFEPVRVCMPAVGEYPRSVWKQLPKDATPLVLSWCHLNSKRYGDETHQAIRKAYEKAGVAEKCLYLSSPLAGHEYDVYHLNEIMTFFDRHCK
ncbi:MAG: hypothetical protein ACI8W8_004803 [Rhodothermales bacterium]|jgi:hypothetical protein